MKSLDHDLESILDHIVESWNKFCNIDYTEDEINEFRESIHRLEYILTKIQIKRNFPDEWQ